MNSFSVHRLTNAPMCKSSRNVSAWKVSSSFFFLCVKKRKRHQYVYELGSFFLKGWTSHLMSYLLYQCYTCSHMVFLMVSSTYGINHPLLTDIYLVDTWQLPLMDQHYFYPAYQAEWLRVDTVPSIQSRLFISVFFFVCCNFTHTDIWRLIYTIHRFCGNMSSSSVDFCPHSSRTQTLPADMSYCFFFSCQYWSLTVDCTLHSDSEKPQSSLWLNWPNLLWWVMQGRW